jgi:serine phosphatase RsbU (regulator of sigma subunit)/Tfp pilus assembly protein PilF
MILRWQNICFGCLIFLSFLSPAVADRVDSLKEILNEATDSQWFQLKHQISQEYLPQQPDSAVAHARQMLKRAERDGNVNYQSHAHHNLGYAHYMMSDFEQALFYWNECLKVRKKLRDTIKIAKTLGNIGVIYKSWGNYSEALDYYFEALRLAQQLDHQQEQAGLYNNIGTAYYKQRDFEKGLRYYRKALSINKKFEDRGAVAKNHGNIANVVAEQGKYSEALTHYHKALQINESLGAMREYKIIYSNLGALYLQAFQEDSSKVGVSYKIHETTVNLSHDALLDSAVLAYKISLKHSKRQSDIWGIAYCHVGMGDIMKELNLPDSTRYYYNKAYRKAKEVGLLEWQKVAAYRLYNFWKENSRESKALEWHERYLTHKDSLFNEEKSKEIGRQEAQFQAEKEMLTMKKTHEKEQAIVEEQNKRQRTIIYSISGGLLLVIGFLALLYNRFRVIRQQRDTIEHQKSQLGEAYQQLQDQNQQIVSSINYAQRIQSAILRADSEFNKIGGDNYFILFKPKETVSGDFYWAYHNGEALLWTAADCTGHGVPGAFMSMIGTRLLNEVIIEKGITDTDRVLNQLRDGIINTLQQKGEEAEMRDGMDMALVKLYIQNSKSKTRAIEFSGAKNPLYVVGENIVNRTVAQKADKTEGTDLIEISGDKQPIGYEQENHQSFTRHKLNLYPGDKLYTFSDGFPDQFGGSRGKKFMYKRFKKLLVDIQDKPMNKQKEILDQTIEDWMAENDEEQIDDISVVGIKLT